MSGNMTLRSHVIATTRNHVLSAQMKEGMNMTKGCGHIFLPKARVMLTGIERQQAEEAQAKLEQRRWERDHFSDGVPVALYEGLETWES